MAQSLYQLSEEMLNIENELEENGGELTPELEKALTFTQEALMNKADSITALIRKFETGAEACKAEKARIAKLQKTQENAVARIKGMVLWNMGAFGIDRIEGNTCKMTRRRSEKMEVNEDALIAGYTHQVKEFQNALPVWAKVEIKIDKVALKNQIKQDGVIPEGADLQENFSLLIK